jgi:ATP-dependent protease Clp ATPase subunit
MLDIMYEAPSRRGTAKCLVTAEAVRRQQPAALLGSLETEQKAEGKKPLPKAERKAG